MALRILVNGWFVGQLATGTGQYLAGLQAWLPRSAQHEYVLVLPELAGALPADGAPPGWTVLRTATPFDRLSSNLAKLWFEQVTFPRACRRLGADVALIPYWGAPWWRPCPIVVTIHDLIPLLLPLYRGGMRQRVYTWLVARTARRAAAVLTDSAASGRDIVVRLGIPAGRVHAIHLAVDPRFAPVRDYGELARVAARYELPTTPFWLYLGGFDARKNLQRLIEAYARLAHGAPGLAGEAASVLPLLVIAGRLPSADTPFTPDPRDLAARLGLAARVHFTGWVDEADKPALYSLASAALFVSEYEGFGLPVLEAQACGCPVITSQC
jgi:glycosyltransferase involved in cell wall biosynthesis